MTQRRAFVLQVKPDRVDEYVHAHGHVWDEMRAALTAAGIRNYTIFRAGTQMFGYFECDDPAAAEAFLASRDVSTRWQDAMADLLEQRVPDGGPPALEEIFRLD
jgi:L-rhamnose mutarotase